MARPKIEISAEQVLKLAGLGAKNEEIADFFDCSTDTIERRFAGDLVKGRANLKMSLRQWQLKSAEKGNATLLIWLGKQMLGQMDKMAHELSGPNGKPIETLNKIEELSDADLDARIAKLMSTVTDVKNG